MNELERVAFINSQTACMLAEMNAMIAHNQSQVACGGSQFYTEQAFLDLPDKYRISYNAVIEFFHR